MQAETKFRWAQAEVEFDRITVCRHSTACVARLSNIVDTIPLLISCSAAPECPRPACLAKPSNGGRFSTRLLGKPGHALSGQQLRMIQQKSCLRSVFEEVGFLDRLKRARDAGFAAVEISTPELYSHSAGEVACGYKGSSVLCPAFVSPT